MMCDCQRRLKQRMIGIDAELEELKMKIGWINHEASFRELTTIEKYQRMKIYLSISKKQEAREELRKFLIPVNA